MSPSSPTLGLSLNFQVGKPTANNMHVQSKRRSTVNHNFHADAENAGLHNDNVVFLNHDALGVVAKVSSMHRILPFLWNSYRAHYMVRTKIVVA